MLIWGDCPGWSLNQGAHVRGHLSSGGRMSYLRRRNRFAHPSVAAIVPDWLLFVVKVRLHGAVSAAVPFLM